MKSSAEIAKLLLRIPYFIKASALPPCRVINDLLRRGVYDAGMSGHVSWNPFELDETEYGRVVNELQKLRSGLLPDDSPLEVQTLDDWNNWRLIKQVGENGYELNQLLRKRHEIVKKIETFNRNTENNDAIAEFQMELMDLDALIGDILIQSSRGE